MYKPDTWVRIFTSAYTSRSCFPDTHAIYLEDHACVYSRIKPWLCASLVDEEVGELKFFPSSIGRGGYTCVSEIKMGLAF
jgi:hypothetical protein